MLGDGGSERDKDSAFTSAIEAGSRLITELCQIIQGDGLVADFVGQVISDTAEGVDVAEILPQIFGQKERNDGEIFVMGACQLASKRLGLFDCSRRRKCDGGRFRLASWDQRRIV